MQYTIKQLAEAFRKLSEIGIEGIIIGDTCINLELGNKQLEGDIDLFVTNMSPIMESNRIIVVAEEKGWSTGTTELGTPSIILRVNDADITVELYENVLDFYIPQELIELCLQEYDINGTKIRCLSKECWLVLKAKRGAMQDLSEIRFALELIERNNVKLDKNKIMKAIEIFGEEAQAIYDRLRSAGLKL